MKTVAIEDLYRETILTFCENLAELGCPKDEKPDMWFRELPCEEQRKVADKMIEIEERYENFAEADEKVNIAAKDDGSISQLVTLELDLPNDVILDLSLMAHEQDITLNELFLQILREIVETKEKCLGEVS